MSKRVCSQSSSDLQGEHAIAAAVRSWRVALFLRLISTLFFSIGIGCFIAEAYTWARTGNWCPLTILDVYRSLNHKMPHSSWNGVERIIEWFFIQPAFLSTSAIFLFVAVVLWSIERRLARHYTLPQVRLLPKPTLLSAAAPAKRPDMAGYIEAAYREIDARSGDER